MLLPKDILTGTYTKPRMFLCEADKTKICQLDPMGLSGSFKFNSYSELTFDIARVYSDIITGETKVNPFYDKVEAIRLVNLEGFGYFEIQDPNINGDGIKEVKSLTANSLEYTLAQRYLENIHINTGAIDSVEVIYADVHGKKLITPVTLYNEDNEELSLLHLVLERVYGWSIGHVDASIATLSRQFEIERMSVYDFIMNEICVSFNCYAIFDTNNNTISFYAENRTAKFIGDGKGNAFDLSPVFDQIGTVTVGGYKTNNYTYNFSTGRLVLGETPSEGSMVEVTDGALGEWETDVYITFDNLAQEMNISYPSDDIKTVLTVKGANDLHIREVNNGLPYIVDLSYFYNKDWMGQDLYRRYTEYLQESAVLQQQYKANSLKVIKLSNAILHEQARVSLDYNEASVHSGTIGTYYIRGGDEATGYSYTEVSLPADYNANTQYYTTYGSDVNETKINNLYAALQDYYKTGSMEQFTGSTSTLKDDFSFISNPSFADLVQALSIKQDVDKTVINFFSAAWEHLGLNLLNSYLASFKSRQSVQIDAGHAVKDHTDYGLYYPVTLVMQSLESAIQSSQSKINDLTNEMTICSTENAKIAENLLLENYFNTEQMLRLNAFLREDEYTDDTFAETGNETMEELFQIKQELLECGQIELSKLREPRLTFSMSLANIYALPEFEPIVNQFQLGNLIKVALRNGYIKHTRLMQVNLNFDDFSDFSCEFGDLAAIRSQTDLHADLLSQAVSAGKTVASNASYWDKGTDTATTLDISIQQGLLDAVESIKSMDATQGVEIDKYGIHLRKEKDSTTGELDPEQGWIINNKFLYSDDGFKTAKSVFGKYSFNGDEYWGLLADAVVAGHIAGSQIYGGTIRIGERGEDENGNMLYNFEVDEEGYITMVGGKSKGVRSNGEEVDFDELWGCVQVIGDELHLSARPNSTSYSESVLTSTQLSFGINNGGDFDPVVWLGLTDMTGKNVTALNYLSVQSEPESEFSPYIELGNFKLQIEADGGLSIIGGKK